MVQNSHISAIKYGTGILNDAPHILLLSLPSINHFFGPPAPLVNALPAELVCLPAFQGHVRQRLLAIHSRDRRMLELHGAN